MEPPNLVYSVGAPNTGAVSEGSVHTGSILQAYSHSTEITSMRPKGKRSKSQFKWPNLLSYISTGQTQGAIEYIEEHPHHLDEVDVKLYNCTPLLWACVCNRRKIVKAFLEEGANPGVCMTGNKTGLHVAAEHGNVGMMQDLLTAGVDVNTRMGDGKVPIHFAAQQCQYKAVRFLVLEGNADPHCRCLMNKTPLDLCLEQTYDNFDTFSAEVLFAREQDNVATLLSAAMQAPPWWSRSTHWLTGKRGYRYVLTVLLTAQRLSVGLNDDHEENGPENLLHLPEELWFYILEMVPRRDILSVSTSNRVQVEWEFPAQVAEPITHKKKPVV
eukprot:m.10313 g.10313  ORF g.10313 m.10313 type:complete len:328 (-) comp4240_c0_seq2:33-1016(-)